MKFWDSFLENKVVMFKVKVKLTIIQPRSIAIFHSHIHMFMIDVRIIINKISEIEELERSQVVKSAFLGHDAVSIVNANPARFSQRSAQNYNTDHAAQSRWEVPLTTFVTLATMVATPMPSRTLRMPATTVRSSTWTITSGTCTSAAVVAAAVYHVISVCITGCAGYSSAVTVAAAKGIAAPIRGSTGTGQNYIWQNGVVVDIAAVVVIAHSVVVDRVHVLSINTRHSDDRYSVRLINYKSLSLS